MSVADRTVIARRPFLSGLVGILALAGIAALEGPRFFPDLFAKHYGPTPYDDLFALLPDRENAVRLGATLMQDRPLPDLRAAAARLRRRLGGHSLAVAIADDLARNQLVVAQGWLLPESLGELCALAARVEPTV